jgi:hypothetical protein
MVVAGLLGREREILTQLTAGLDEAGALVGVEEPDTGQAMKILGTLTETLLTGLLSGLSSATVLIVGVVTGLFILLFLMKDWRRSAQRNVEQSPGDQHPDDRHQRGYSCRGYATGPQPARVDHRPRPDAAGSSMEGGTLTVASLQGLGPRRRRVPGFQRRP